MFESKCNNANRWNFNLTPDGISWWFEVSTTVEDMARWGTLFTPSWKAVADEPVISQKP
ncbi:hypothetical protein O9929_11905 [Vibrio lentus]|nr:hypothetical protein [Vibrio lentus]